MYDPELAQRLKYSIAEFSAFKETSFKKNLERLLTKNGKIQPWSKFKEQAYAISGDYNKRYLKTEYHQTVATANMAGKWKNFEANQDLYPNLKYVDAGDGRVRDKHREWDGTVLPLNHPWWQSHYPPSDWGCRCDAVQTDEEVTVKIPKGDAKKGFDGNAGITGEVFKDSAYKQDLSTKELDSATAMANKLFRQEPGTREFIRQQRKQIKSWANENLVESTVKHPALDNRIGFSKTAIKEFVNQPYKYQTEKFNIIKNIDQVLSEAEYLGHTDFKKSNLAKRSHIFEIEVKQEKSWLIVNENYEGKLTLYSISDGKKITKGLKK